MENNKKRKLAAVDPLERQKSAEIPDILMFCGRYELCAGEVSKSELKLTKECYDGAIKLPKIMKNMLRTIYLSNLNIKHNIDISGMYIAGKKVFQVIQSFN